MNYLAINIALLLVSATVLHFLLFKKSLRGISKRYFPPARKHFENIVEILSIISLFGIVFLMANLSEVNKYFVIITLGIILLLILRMVRSSDR